MWSRRWRRAARYKRAHTRRRAATCRSRDALPQTVNDIFSIFTFSRYFFEDIHASTLQQLRYIVINTNFVLLQQKLLDAALVGILFCANFQNPLYTAAPYRGTPGEGSLTLSGRGPCTARSSRSRCRSNGCHSFCTAGRSAAHTAARAGFRRTRPPDKTASACRGTKRPI